MLNAFDVGDRIRPKRNSGIYWDVIQVLDETDELLVMRRYMRYGLPKYACRIVANNDEFFTKD